ncbi:hypothetical protein ETU09_00625 [Apibacter muscae]|uniref:Uncharacterized protein n=1 Tax=Apibacter muscae TaxID=2509004 RepID=A0A563DJW2_9FLAO|nr:hypothetical protein [Apibacter muscae]TWP30538.1 hypothetical protein ETU09_00625 [Apibacter muscae]
MQIDIHNLRDLLSYDSEEVHFLTFDQRCEIQRNISNLINKIPLEFSEELEQKIIENLAKIRINEWTRPSIRYVEEDGALIKRYYKK